MQSWLAPMQNILAKALKDSAVHNRSGLPPFRLPQVAQQVVSGIDKFAADGDAAAVMELGQKLGKQGLALRSVLAMSRVFVREALPRVGAEEPGVPAEQLARAHDFMTLLVDAVVTQEAREIFAQRDDIQGALERLVQTRERDLRSVIQELSTPIMPVHDHILVLPLVGAVDPERASRITEHLLRAVAERQARTVIIDVTGVPTIDAEVAASLVRATAALRLLGFHPVLVGIRPDVARTLTQLGADLIGMVVLSTLQSGIAYALRLHGLEVRSAAVRRPVSTRMHGSG